MRSGESKRNFFSSCGDVTRGRFEVDALAPACLLGATVVSDVKAELDFAGELGCIPAPDD
jgi:hypothetical protein